MYRDVVQWSKIRHRILVQGRSIRRVASEKGIDPRTIRKMLDHVGQYDACDKFLDCALSYRLNFR
jgi:hypothetical protein